MLTTQKRGMGGMAESEANAELKRADNEAARNERAGRASRLQTSSARSLADSFVNLHRPEKSAEKDSAGFMGATQ